MTDLFLPSASGYRAPTDDASYDKLGEDLGDRRDGKVYVYDRRIIEAVQTAQATGRPLLLRGPAGSGKSSLAPFVARWLGRRFYSFTVTARTQARDLMWSYDALRRLNDAQTAGVLPDKERKEAVQRVQQLENYLTPRALWWAFDPKSAKRHGLKRGKKLQAKATEDPGIGPSGTSAVVLVDEIDKADPDVPNNLLECLGSLQFSVEETGATVRVPEREAAPLVMVTTNDERELPAAFLRRCAVLHLRAPEGRDAFIAHLRQIAGAHFDSETITGPDQAAVEHEAKVACYASVAGRFFELAAEAGRKGLRAPSTAEYLDTVRACLHLGARPDATDDEGQHLWSVVQSVALAKDPAFGAEQDGEEGDDA